MSIPQAAPSIVPQLVYGLASYISMENCMAAASGLEAGFYAMLRGGSQTTYKVVNWIREASIAQVSRIQTLFIVINGSIILVTAKRLLEEAQKRFSASVVDASAAPGMFASIPVALGVGSTVALSVYLLNRFLTSPSEPAKSVGQVQISENLSMQQKIANVLEMTKLVMSLALVILSQNRISYAISAASAAYSLYKNMDLKWITFSRAFPYWSNNPQVPITQLKANYNVLALPLAEAAAHETCEICHDPDEQVDMAFCADHVFHRACIADLAISKSDTFINNPKIVKTATDHFQDGFYTHTSHDYAITVSEDNFPSCPVCQEIPVHNSCDIEVTDAVHGHFNASVTIQGAPVDRQYLFENLYAIYNVAQAALAFLQTYSALAGAIFTIQKVMLVFDVIGYAMTAYYLYKNLNEKFNQQDKWWIKLAIIAGLVSFAAASYFVVLQVNAYLQSAIVLKDLAGQLNLSPETLKTLEMSWNGPLSHQLMQTLYVNRIASLTALTFFSKQWKTNLLSIAAQVGSLAGISSLKWIEITQTLVRPDAMMESLSLTSHYLVDRVCAVPEHLLSPVQSIVNYTTHFFDNCTWERFWEIRYYNGMEMGRSLNYAFSLQKKAIESCLCGIIPTLIDYKIKVIDAFYGAANVAGNAFVF